MELSKAEPSNEPNPTRGTGSTVQSPSDAFSQHSASGEALSEGRPRRTSIEEDALYEQLILWRPAEPPSYESAMKAAIRAQKWALAATAGHGASQTAPEDVLPQYSCDVHLKGIFCARWRLRTPRSGLGTATGGWSTSSYRVLRLISIRSRMKGGGGRQQNMTAWRPISRRG